MICNLRDPMSLRHPVILALQCFTTHLVRRLSWVFETKERKKERCLHGSILSNHCIPFSVFVRVISFRFLCPSLQLPFLFFPPCHSLFFFSSFKTMFAYDPIIAFPFLFPSASFHGIFFFPFFPPSLPFSVFFPPCHSLFFFPSFKTMFAWIHMIQSFQTFMLLLVHFIL